MRNYILPLRRSFPTFLFRSCPLAPSPPTSPHLSSWTCYNARCINCGLKNSQLRLGGTVEANESELQRGEKNRKFGPRTEAYHPADTDPPTDRKERHIGYLPPRAGSVFRVVGGALIFQASTVLHLPTPNTLLFLCHRKTSGLIYQHL